MKKARKLGSLSVAETRRLLGSDEPISIGKLPIDPLGMRLIASMVRERLVSRGGRPSDPAWTIVRKVPMRPETWKELDRCAQELQGQNVRVSAGQVAAIALEKGLQSTLKLENAEQPRANYNYSFSQEVQLNSRRALLAQKHGMFNPCV